MFARAEAAVAAAREARADSAAARLRNLPEAGLPLDDHDARDTAALALHADRLIAQLRSPTGRNRREEFEQLVAVNWAVAKLVVDGDMRRNGRGGCERLDVIRVR